MDQFHQLLNNLNQNKSAKSQSRKPVKPKPIPPRQFPKQQYQKFTRKLWLTVVAILIVLFIGGVAIGVHHNQNVEHQASHSHVERPARPKHHVKSTVHHHKMIKHQHANRLSPKQGEKLLGHWLIKLHYSEAQSQRILNIYQRSNVNEENSITQWLSNITNGKSTSAQKQSAIQNYLHQKFASTK